MSGKTDSGNRGGKTSGGLFGWLAAVTVLALLAALAPATTLIMAIGILPTLALACGDPNGDRRATLAVGVPNLAGVLPVLLSLWQGRNGMNGGHNLDAAVALLMQPMTWLLLYGGAGLGLLIYSLLPRAVTQFAVTRAEHGIAARRGYQQTLERTWGMAVKTDRNDST